MPDLDDHPPAPRWLSCLGECEFCPDFDSGCDLVGEMRRQKLPYAPPIAKATEDAERLRLVLEAEEARETGQIIRGLE